MDWRVRPQPGEGGLRGRQQECARRELPFPLGDRSQKEERVLKKEGGDPGIEQMKK